MRVLVCGGRDYTDSHKLHEVLDSLDKIELVIIEGGARGADTMASCWAAFNSVECLTFHANWNKYGRGAGHIRNQQMLDEGKPDLVIAFPGGKGTANMISRAKKAGVDVIEEGVHYEV